MNTEWRPQLLKLIATGTSEKNITQPQDREAMQHFRTLRLSQDEKTLKEFREIADDHGLALIENQRDERQAKDLDSYRLVKKVDDEGNDIDPQELHENIDRYTIAMITFEKQ